jgi:hypothetical protein
MDILSGDITSLVFRRVALGNIGDISLDSRMLEVLMELDGKKSLGSIAKKTGINIVSLRDAVTGLMKSNLIEKVETAGAFIDKEFMGYLVKQLALAIGPVAEVIIEDAVSDLGLKISEIPIDNVAELIDYLSGEIQRGERKEAFKISMIKKIKEKGY